MSGTIKKMLPSRAMSKCLYYYKNKDSLDLGLLSFNTTHCIIKCEGGKFYRTNKSIYSSSKGPEKKRKQMGVVLE